MKYQLNVNLKNFNLKHAGTKAVTDCEHLLVALGYKSISLAFNKSPYLIGFSLIKLTAQLLALTIMIKPRSLIITQYPLIGINRIFKFFVHILKVKKCYVTCIIHDINTLRYQEPDQQVNKEIYYLNAYDMVISHNKSMTDWLKSKGLTSKVTSIQIFDYLFQKENIYNRLDAFSTGNNEIIFAGNLNRSEFIYHLSPIKELQFALYGPTNNSQQVTNQFNVKWKGTFEPEDLVAKLEGTFGLIWDGDLTTDCTGAYGSYIQYNNPHKLSLYIASGLPIIIPVKAALSTFVEKNQIGITVNSLNEIGGKISKISLSEYRNMIEKIDILKYHIKQGYYFSKVIGEIEKEYVLLDQLTETAITNRKINRLKNEKINLQS